MSQKQIAPFYHVTFKWPYINQFLVLRAQLLGIDILSSHLRSGEIQICGLKKHVWFEILHRISPKM